jgi:chemotaxis protein methyltransferase CheR
MTPSTRPRSESIVSDGEFPFTAADFAKIAALVHGECGIVLHEGKANLVYSRLTKRLRTIGLRSFREYCQLIESSEGLAERQAMIAAMTTNVTRFFREPHHFDHFRAMILPGIISDARAGARIRLWSAGCSSGEEPYSLAMLLLDAMPDIAERDVVILATDIDHNVLATGREGAYGASQMAHLPADMRARWTVGGKSGPARIAPAVRDLIRFNELNLLGQWPMKGRFRTIFCRNVMIYFDEETQARIWTRFAQCLEPGGTLFIGHSERIASDNGLYDLVAQTTYRLKKGARP